MRLSDEMRLCRARTVCVQENSGHTDEGLVTLFLTAEGDMRSARSNLKAPAGGRHFISDENGCHVCDEPHRAVVKDLVTYCEQVRLNRATALALGLVESGDCSSLDITTRSFEYGVSTQSQIFYGSVARLCAVAVATATTS
ncbi:unnamed protein product [Hyaloperonospora brassicae]|uniref:Uncharacterized protein n=1 Tax=Hyaloperonospora brassicae TaxID=162125 RepID=A0AAV0V0L1_HYABA|nr:unnamed protein product [Hyaloperonospora brassicae]